jgi:hypothetical protein
MTFAMNQIMEREMAKYTEGVVKETMKYLAKEYGFKAEEALEKMNSASAKVAIPLAVGVKGQSPAIPLAVGPPEDDESSEDGGKGVSPSEDGGKEVGKEVANRGRPKKEKKVVSANAADDLIATLVAQAQQAKTAVMREEEPEKADALAAKKAEQEQADALAAKEKEQAKADALAAKEQAKADALAAKEQAKEAAKLAKKAEQEAAKLAKKAEQEAAKLAKKAEQEAAKLAKKAEQEEEKKAQQELAKKATKAPPTKKAKEAAPVEELSALMEELELEKEDDEGEANSSANKTSTNETDSSADGGEGAEPSNSACGRDGGEGAEPPEESINVKKFVFEGTTYLRSSDDVLYDIKSQEPVGMWNEEENCIDEIEIDED